MFIALVPVRLRINFADTENKFMSLVRLAIYGNIEHHNLLLELS